MSTLAKFTVVIACGCALLAPALAAEDERKPPATRSAGRAINDSVISGKVKASLVRTDAVVARDINVMTRDGVVELSGSVQSKEQAEIAGQVAAEVEGVERVDNRLVAAGR